MNTIELVNEILNEFPETQTNDKMLCYRVYERISKENGQGIFIPFNLFKQFPAFETISRIRRKQKEEKEKFQQETRKKDGEVIVDIHLTKQMSSDTAPNSWMIA